MKILLIGNFAPPYEDESLHNLSLLNRLKDEGHDCCVMNSSQNHSKEEEFVSVKGYFDFVFKLIRYGWRKDIVHYLTRGYTRLALLKVMTSILIGRIFLAKPIVTIHPEMFSIFGQIRSKVGGEQVIYLSFFLAHKIIFGDKDTCDIISTYKIRNNFEIIPYFIHIPEDIRENERLSLKKLQDKKKVIVFSNVRYPSLLFDVLNKMLTGYLGPDIGIAVSFSEKSPPKLQYVIEDAGNRLSDNLVFIESDDMRLLSLAYARADLVLKPFSCDGRIFFDSFIISLKKPASSGNYLYFPISLSLIKGGKVAELCASIFNNLLMESAGELPDLTIEDFYMKMKEMYLKE